ncbi:protein kinase [Acidaminobacter sp. JC074]|uniref:protein kinase domain-containing protein n=1 Tax=Acidaminobacter sp. JC074 TaxID=2530199 RepID=UPI001F0D8E1B
MKVNQKVGRYTVTEVITDSTAYCRQVDHGTEWFIKFLKEDSREVDYLKLLDHCRIPRVIDVYTKDEGVYYIMDQVRGVTLYERLKLKDITYKEMIQSTIHLCQILEHLHCMNVVHGDIKLENLVFDEQFGIHLIDFGSAFMENDSDSFTMDFVAPERLLDTYLADERSDIYCLGLVMKIMLRHVKKRTIKELFYFIRLCKLKRIIKKAIMVQPERRYQSATDLKESLIHLKFA